MSYLENLRRASPGATPRDVQVIIDGRRDFDPRAARLESFGDFLLSAGWEKDGDGCWIAPERMRDALALNVGRGPLYLWTAVAAQVQADEWELLQQFHTPPAIMEFTT